jgi:hypothetical protein
MTMDNTDFTAYTDNQSLVPQKWLKVNNGFSTVNVVPYLNLRENASQQPIWVINPTGSNTITYSGLLSLRVATADPGYPASYNLASYNGNDNLVQWVKPNGDGYYSGSLFVGSGSQITGSLLVSGSSLTFDLPSKANNYVLKSDANGGATWVDPNIFPATKLIYSGSVTASVDITNNLFSVTSASNSLMTISGSSYGGGIVGISGQTSPNYQLNINAYTPTTSNTTGSLRLYYPALNSAMTFETCLGPIGTLINSTNTLVLQSSKGSNANHVYIGTSGTQPYNNYTELVVNPGNVIDLYQSSGTIKALSVATRIATTGSTAITLVEAVPTFDQAGAGASTVSIKGFYYNPIYSIAARTSSNVAFENTSGDNRFNSTSGSTFIGPVTSSIGNEKLVVQGAAKITDVLVLPFQDPLPSSKPTGSVAISGSGGTFVGMYVYNGTSWINVKA